MRKVETADYQRVTRGQIDFEDVDTDVETKTALVIYHRDGGQVVPLVEGRPVVVGRQPPADLVIAEMTLSRRHARFTLRDDVVLVEDLASTNGTFLEGERIEQNIFNAGGICATGVGADLDSNH